jgi:hypothetical protein
MPAARLNVRDIWKLDASARLLFKSDGSVWT